MLIILFLMFLLLLSVTALYLIEFAITHHFPSDQTIFNDQKADAARVNELNELLRHYGYYYEPCQDIFCLRMDAPQRNAGFYAMYEEAFVSLGMLLDTERICFPYQGKTWLIEFRKGQYGIYAGGEIQIYHTSIESDFWQTRFDCVDDDSLFETAFVLKYGKKKILHRLGTHWCLNGFRVGTVLEPDMLSMNIRITFPKRSMMLAFLKAARAVGYQPSSLKGFYRTAFLHFDTPHTPVPSTKTILAESILLSNSQFYCDAFQNITKEFPNTIDKFTYIRILSDSFYQRLFTIGIQPSLYESFFLPKSALPVFTNRKQMESLSD